MNHHTAETARETIRRFRAIAGTVVVVILAGTIFYHYVEHLHWLDSMYFCVMTLTTVGFGDFAPKTAIGKIFTMFYVLIGIGILAAFANNILKTGMARKFLRQQDAEEVMELIEKELKNEKTT